MATSSTPPEEPVEISPDQESAKNLHIHLTELVAGGMAAVEIFHLMKKWWLARKLHREGLQTAKKGLIPWSELKRLPFGNLSVQKKDLGLVAANKKEAAFIGLSALALVWVVLRWLFNRSHYKHLQAMANTGGTAVLHPAAANATANAAQPQPQPAAQPAPAQGGHDDHGGHGGSNPFVLLFAIVGGICVALLFIHLILTTFYPNAMRVSPQFAPRAHAVASPPSAPATTPAPQVPDEVAKCTASSPCDDGMIAARDPSKNDDEQSWTVIKIPVGQEGKRYTLKYTIDALANLAVQCQIDNDWVDFDPDKCFGASADRWLSVKKDADGNYIPDHVSHFFVES